MLDALKSFFAELTDAPAPERFAANDYRLAAAALLIHAAAIDGAISQVERDKLHAVIAQRFNLDDDATHELIDKATEAENDAIDLYHFTSLLNRTLDEAGRQRMIEMMWQVTFADGHVTEFEDNLIWRAADLLGVSSRQRVEMRAQVAEAEAKTEKTDS
jgi:uncharacterized tellurite resistance protein B-like protein